ncbi:MAG: hypothetical protein AAGJ29_03990 [Pseudomonadota bacterium]
MPKDISPESAADRKAKALRANLHRRKAAKRRADTERAAANDRDTKTKT